MRMRFAVLTLVLFVAVTAMAQRPPRMTPQERTDKLAKELSLTDTQKAQVLELFQQEEKSMPHMKPPEEGGQVDREAMRAAMEKRRTERDAKMKAILTEEQYKVFSEMRGGMPPGPPKEMKPPEGK